MTAASASPQFVFLDRDGVINRDSPDYIKNWNEFEFLPGSLEAMARLTRSGFQIIIITNQSIINRGMVSQAVLEDIFQRMAAAVTAAGGAVLDIFFCPHRPDENCACRKPRPGMILQAARRYHIDLTRAYMIGDNPKDIECARNAGVGTAVLVKTGLDPRVEEVLARKRLRPDHIAPDLAAAARWITAAPPDNRMVP